MVIKQIYCCQCEKTVDATKEGGRSIYPHREDLWALKFYRCPHCLNHVGTHRRSHKPLGCIPSPEIKNARRHIHALIDPVWKSRKLSRSQLYNSLSEALGYQYHTAWIRDIEEARTVYKVAKKLFY